MKTVRAIAAALAALAAAQAGAVRLAVDASGGLTRNKFDDFDKSALTVSGGTVAVAKAGYTGEARGLLFVTESLGFSLGVAGEGGGHYTSTQTMPASKKNPGAVVTQEADYSAFLVPISVHYRLPVPGIALGLEAGVDLASGAVKYAESTPSAKLIDGTLNDSGTGMHVAGDAAYKIGAGVWGFLRVGYLILTLNRFQGALNDNGTIKTEQLYMIKDSATGLETLGVDTSASLTSSNHRLAQVASSGLRLTVGLRLDI